jgi:CubicO group peptidase (beta-lactamase class C family)
MSDAHVSQRKRISLTLFVPIAAGALVLVAIIVFILYPDPGESVPSTGSDDHFSRIDAFVQDQMDASNIPGISIAIVSDGQIVHSGGFGDDGRGSRVTPQTPFWIGSNTKSFTALSVMQLVEAGRLELDAPVQRYMPDFRVADEDASSRITVRQLLNQTSGFSRSSGVKPVLKGDVKTLEETVRDLRNVELNRPVGERYEYSNLNFVVLGLLVERVSGESWPDYIEHHIFEPLGMSNSFSSIEEAEDKGLAATHRFAFGFPFESSVKYLPGFAPTGWLYSTSEDMARYLSMYLEGGLYGGNRSLSEQGMETMLRGNTNHRTQPLQGHEFTFQYGQGWFVGAFGAAEDARWHLGNLPEFTAWMVLLPETNQGVVVLINAGSQFELFNANEVFSRIPVGIVNILRGDKPPTGMDMTRFYILFDAVVIAVLAIQLWSLIRIASRPIELSGRWDLFTSTGPLIWELGLSLVILALYPMALGGSWPASIRTLPDVSLFLMVMLLLWLLSAVVRIGRLLRVRQLGRQPAAGSDAAAR